MPRFLTRQLLGLTLALVALRASGAGEGPNATVDFAREIQPLLSDFCYRCHGPDAGSRKSGLRLDQREAALAGGKSGLPAIVPGKPDQSELIARIYSSDPEEVMPSADSHRTLSDLQKERLARWVAEGSGLGRSLGLRRPSPPVAAAPPIRPISPDRCIRRREPRRRQDRSVARGRPAHPAPPRHLRPDRTPADAAGT